MGVDLELPASDAMRLAADAPENELFYVALKGLAGGDQSQLVDLHCAETKTVGAVELDQALNSQDFVVPEPEGDPLVASGLGPRQVYGQAGEIEEIIFITHIIECGDREIRNNAPPCQTSCNPSLNTQSYYGSPLP